jgi:hypothetical protein
VLKSPAGSTENSNNGYIDEGVISNPNVFNAKAKADALYNAMRTSGTNEKEVFEVLTGVTPSQFAQIATAFGRKSYNTVLGNQYNVNPFVKLDLLPLKTWLKEELNEEDYLILKKKYPMYL